MPEKTVETLPPIHKHWNLLKIRLFLENANNVH